jgi:lysyl-tRNA synthetase class 1
MLLNLASVVNAETPDMLWGFLRRYSPDAAPGKSGFVDGMVDRAIAYYRDVVRPQKQFRVPDAMERAALDDLAATLTGLPADVDAEAIQNAVYEVGKRHPFPDLKAWFGCLYQVLLGQAEGPRFGGFIALYGIDETVALIRNALATAGSRPADAA